MRRIPALQPIAPRGVTYWPGLSGPGGVGIPASPASSVIAFVEPDVVEATAEVLQPSITAGPNATVKPNPVVATSQVLTPASVTGYVASPPGGSGSLLVGATIDLRYPGDTYTSTTNAFNSRIGANITVARRFSTGTPTNWNSAANFVVDKGLRHQIMSVKGATDARPTQAELEAFMSTVPNDGKIHWLLVHHEPENDRKQGKPTHTPAWFQSKLNTQHAAWIAAGRPAHIPLGLCLTSFWERDSDPETSAEWFPRSAIIRDFTLFLDPYDPQNNITMENCVYQTLDLWEAAGGIATKWGVAEMGTMRTGSAGATWISDAADYVRTTRPGVAMCYFHSAVSGDWWLDDPLMQAALGAEV